MTRTLALALACSGALAQDLTPTAPPQTRPVVIAGATVHTVSGEVIENGIVGFNDGRITMLGRADDLLPRIQLSDDTEMIDATGLHLYPAIFAANTQLGLVEISSVRATLDTNETGDFTPEVRAASSINPDSTLIPVARSNGVLLFASLPIGGRVPGRASVLHADGWTWEDMTVLDDAGLVINWPQTRPRHVAFADESPDDQQRRIREALDELDAFFDAAQAYLAATATHPDHPVDLRFEAMRTLFPPSPPRGEGRGAGASEPATHAQRPLLINADDVDDITSALTWASARGLRVVFLGGRDAPLCSDLLRQHDAAVILDGTHLWPKRDDSPHDDPFTLPARLQAAGVRWCLSPSDRGGNERNLPYEAARAAAFGLDPAVALRSITLSPAEILGIADDYGSIDRGKSATLFLTTGDCLEITSNVTAAWIDGRPLDLSNKQTELRDLYRQKYRQLGVIED